MFGISIQGMQHPFSQLSDWGTCSAGLKFGISWMGFRADATETASSDSLIIFGGHTGGQRSDGCDG